MLGDPYVPIESKFATALRFTLTGQQIPFAITDETKQLLKDMTKDKEIPVNADYEGISRYL